MLFRYVAVPKDQGSHALKRGEIAGDTSRAARAALRKIGLQVVTLKPLDAKPLVSSVISHARPQYAPSSTNNATRSAP